MVLVAWDSIFSTGTHYGLNSLGNESGLVGKIFCTHLDWPCRPPSLLYSKQMLGLFAGAKWPVHSFDHPPTSSAETEETVEREVLYLYFCEPLWPVTGCTLLPLPICGFVFPLFICVAYWPNFYSLGQLDT